MYPRTNYEMTEVDLAAILEACKPVAAIMIGGSFPSSQQENANNAWAALGRKMGFDPMTVQPRAGMGDRFFTAVPSETAEARDARLAREAADLRRSEIIRLTDEIAERRQRLAVLESGQP